MMGKIRPLVFSFFCFATLMAGSLCAQSDAKILLANLKQDLELVSRDLNSLRSEVEMLRRENAQLRVAIHQDNRSNDSSKQSGAVLELQNRLQALELAFRQSEREACLLSIATKGFLSHTQTCARIHLQKSRSDSSFHHKLRRRREFP